jgi:hypothetical protein
MTTPIDIALAELDAQERGFVLGCLVAGRPDASDTVAALPSPSRERCAEALAAFRALPRAERVYLTGVLAREALAPLPAGIENVHPDHLQRALAPESSTTIWLVGRHGPAGLRTAAELVLARRGELASIESAIPARVATDVVADLQRAALASIVSVPALPPGVTPQRAARRLAALSPAALIVEVTTEGADVLGLSLRGADETVVQRAAARAGVRSLGARLAREEGAGPHAAFDADLLRAVAQRLPGPLADELLAAATV